jgi:hypothetical protein
MRVSEVSDNSEGSKVSIYGGERFFFSSPQSMDRLLGPPRPLRNGCWAMFLEPGAPKAVTFNIKSARNSVFTTFFWFGDLVQKQVDIKWEIVGTTRKANQRINQHLKTIHFCHVYIKWTICEKVFIRLWILCVLHISYVKRMF